MCVCVPVVHSEYILSHSPELHDDVLDVGLVDNLEILNARLRKKSILNSCATHIKQPSHLLAMKRHFLYVASMAKT